jgi:SAM-dependent methyltransferase
VAEDVNDLVAVYEAGDENVRMVAGSNRVEWLRTLELLDRWLPPTPARLLDVGGGPGRYAALLGERGYAVTLLDPVPKHIAQATARGVDAVLGDARDLPFEDAVADVVLMLGPLYHLPDAQDRARALREAVRCVVPGGVVVVAAMSRWAKPGVKASLGQSRDPEVMRYLQRVLADGHDPDGDAFDRTSYNHDPAELHRELAAAGLTDINVLGVEGPLGPQARLDETLTDEGITLARIAEASNPHPSIHLLAGGRAPGGHMAVGR